MKQKRPMGAESHSGKGGAFATPSPGWEKFRCLLLVLLLLIQGAMVVWFGSQKVGYHEDEMATYELANYPNFFFSTDEKNLETWQEGNAFQRALSVEGEERFNYAIPYHNQEQDVHPPLYYFIIHTLSSLVPGVFSKWIGILPNLVFTLLSTVLLFWIARQLFRSNALGLLAAAFWGVSVGCMSAAVYIRMYAMLTLACLLLVWAHLRAIEEFRAGRLSPGTMVALALCTVLGTLTQYYFLVFCFFWCGCWFFYLLARRSWGALVRYVGTEFAALVVSVAIFPQMLRHIFSGSRGQEAFSNLSESGEYWPHLKSVLSVISSRLTGGWMKELVFLSIAIIALCTLNRILLHGAVHPHPDGGVEVSVNLHLERALSLRISGEGLVLLALGVTVAGYILLITKIAPNQLDRYYMCLFPFLAILLVALGEKSFGLFCKRRGARYLCLGVILLLVTLFSYRSQSVNYLYKDWTVRAEQLSVYEGYPTIILNHSYSWAPDRYILERNSRTFQCKKNDLSSLAGLKSDPMLENGFLLYTVGTGVKNVDALVEKVREYLPIGEYQLVTSTGGDPVYFCTLEVAS